MKKVLITQSNYIPWKGYFDAINYCDEFVIYDTVQFTRRDWRNRNRIKTAQGPQWLTIPVVVKGKFEQLINETMVSDPAWAEKHWKVLSHSYSRARYFEDYCSKFETLYKNMTDLRLSSINHTFMAAICDILGIQTKISWSDALQVTGGPTERLVKICVALNATDYFTGPSAKAYLDEAVFDKHKVRIHYLDFSGYPEYRQLYPPFDHHVTILDLLFNEGPNARSLMKSFSA